MSNQPNVVVRYGFMEAAFWVGFWVWIILISGSPDLIDGIVSWLKAH